MREREEGGDGKERGSETLKKKGDGKIEIREKEYSLVKKK